jgi:hypothetical protein
MVQVRQIFIFEKDGVFQACRDNRYKFRFAEEDEGVLVGIGVSDEDAIEELYVVEETKG